MEQPQITINQQLTDPLIWLRTTCGRSGLRISDGQLSLIGEYVRLLLEWNQKINLISRRDEENVWQSHILHSIAPLFRLKVPDGARVIDLGTGGGLPGIPLRILTPAMRLVMVDSTQKKITAVTNMIGRLGLTETSAVWGRAEELGKRKDLMGTFDIAVARGVGPLDELATLSHPFIRSAGPAASNDMLDRCLMAYKGGELEAELKKTRLNKHVQGVKELALTGEGLDPAAEKKLVIVQF